MTQDTQRRRRRAARFDRSAGVTLVELMIAAGLLTTAMVLMFGSLISVSDTRRMSEGRTIAAERAASVLEELKGLDGTALLAYVPPAFTDLGANGQVAVRLFAADGSTVAVPLDSMAPTPSLPNPCEVQVLVTWQDRGRIMTQRASTLLALGA